MKKILSVLVATMIAGTAFAGEYEHTRTSGTSSSAVAASGSQASNQGNAQSISFNSPGQVEYSGSYTIKNVPNVMGPNLTTSNDTCMGSSSGGVSGPGFGVSLGTTWTDTNCKMLKNSRELWNMGMKAASLALLCKDADNKEALEITGFVCPQTKQEKSKQAAVQQEATIVPVADTNVITSDLK